MSKKYNSISVFTDNTKTYSVQRAEYIKKANLSTGFCLDTKQISTRKQWRLWFLLGFLPLTFLLVVFLTSLGYLFESNTVFTYFSNDEVVKINRSSTPIFEYHLIDGRYSILKDGVPIVSKVMAEAISNDVSYKSTELKNHTFLITELNDQFGSGLKLDVISFSIESQVEMQQSYYFYEKYSYIVFDVTLTSKNDKMITSNYLAPFVLDGMGDGVNITIPGSTSILSVPYDNDEYVSYKTNEYRKIKMNTTFSSSEVTVFYGSSSRTTLLLGAIDHKNFKNGINVVRNDAEKINNVRLFSGVTNAGTRDRHYTASGDGYVTPHGSITSESVVSSKMIIGCFDDYIDALDTFGKANATMETPLPWNNGVPVGWMSWGAYGMDLTWDNFITSADFMASELPDFNNNGVTYVNFDSFNGWGSEHTMADAVEHLKKNGQTPGAYATPYTLWWQEGPRLDLLVPETDSEYTWREMMLKNKDGSIIRIGNSSSWYRMVLDPTHPGTQKYITRKLQRDIVDPGYGYVKLDFISDSAVEGEFYDPAITTGVQAYRFGMNKIKELLSKEKTGRDIYISISISPIFPGGFAHSRRISCDAFGAMSDIKYMLNSLTFGWWISGNIYKYNDPDHTVIYKYYGNPDTPYAITKEAEGVSRYNASVIGGTVLLISDDFCLDGARERAKRILKNPDLLELALQGETFRPIGFVNDNESASTYYLVNNGKTYIAIFNFYPLVTNIKVDLASVGFATTSLKNYTLRSLNTGDTIMSSSKFIAELDPYQSIIYEVSGI